MTSQSKLRYRHPVWFTPADTHTVPSVTTHLWGDAQVCKHIVEDELLDLEVHHHVPVELALQQPPQRLQVGDIVADLGLTAGSPSAARRHRPEEQPRGVRLRRWSRPAGPGLEGAVIYHYGDRRRGHILSRDLKNRVGRGFTVLKWENLIDRFGFGSHFGCMSQ